LSKLNLLSDPACKNATSKGKVIRKMGPAVVLNRRQSLQQSIQRFLCGAQVHGYYYYQTLRRNPALVLSKRR
jgi:hypothetical protein